MGAGNSKQLKAANEFLASSTFETIVKIKTSCRATASNNQELDIKVGADKGLIEKCLASGQTATECSNLYSSGTNVSDIFLGSEILISAECQLEESDVQKLTEELSAQLEAKTKQTNDDAGTFFKELLKFNNTDNNEIKNTIVTQLKNTFTKESVNEMLTEFKNEQKLKIEVGLSKDTNIKGVVLQTKVDMLTKMVSKNSSLTELVRTVDAKMTTESEQENKGLVAMWESLMGVFTSLFGAFAWGAIASIACCVCCCCILCVLLLTGVIGGGGSGNGRRRH
jgi:membrane-associated HD superfamily phosphohydrolase